MSHRNIPFRGKQRDVIVEMLKSAVPMDSSSQSSGAADDGNGSGATGSWKLLIFDSIGRDLIAPLLKVKDLRELGVTLHMMIDKPREAVPGAPAIYFCAPTEANIQRIATDCTNELYQWVYINFTSPIQRKLLETLAEQLTLGGKLQSIRHIRVVDRTLSYLAVANDLFTLMLPRTLYTLNSRHTQDAQMEECLQRIAQGATHAVLSTQAVPVVVYTKSGAAEEVAKRVSTALHDLLQERAFTPQASGALGRPLLLVVDRTADLPCALHHPFSYRGLLHDTLGMHLNKVEIVVDGKEKTFEIDPETDAFFKSNAANDFGNVGSNVEAALSEYKREVEHFSKENSGAGSSGATAAAMMAVSDDHGDAATMSKMLAHAPKLAEKKRSLDAHMTIAYSILRKIKENELDGFYGVEAGLMNHDDMDRDHFRKLMEGACSLQDKQRLYLITYLLAEGEDALAELETFLPFCSRQEPPAPDGSAAAATGSGGAHASTSTARGQSRTAAFPALQYIKHLRSWSLHSPAAAAATAASASSLTSGWGFAQSLAKGIAATLKGSSEAEYMLTRLVDALLQDASTAGASRQAAMVRGKLLDSLSAIDPRNRQPIDVTDIHFHQAIVFVVGGGSINEYDNLKRWEVKHPRKSIIYGCTEMLKGEDVLDELARLGSE